MANSEVTFFKHQEMPFLDSLDQNAR